jgi:hypothetical protein
MPDPRTVLDRVLDDYANLERRVSELEQALDAVLQRCEDANQAWSRLDVAAIARAALSREGSTDE